jgi:protein-S-isoprenylcysteine O-methyltransferase Ste14
MSDVHLAKPSAVTHRTLRAGHEQHVVDTGPYRLVRHPGYTGSLLTWTGLALASRSTSFSPWSPRCWAGFHHRITAEQQQPQRDLPGYLAYSQHTKKLIPFVC